MNSLVCLKDFFVCVQLLIDFSYQKTHKTRYILLIIETYLDVLPIISLFPPTSHLIIFHLKYYTII